MGYTHYQSHTRALHKSDKNQKNCENPPTELPPRFVASENDQICDEGHAFENDNERHEEPDSAPHRAEVTALSPAIFILGEIFTRFRDRGTATVEAVRVVEVASRWLARGRVSGFDCLDGNRRGKGRGESRLGV